MDPALLLQLLYALVGSLTDGIGPTPNVLAINQVVLRYYRGWLAVFFRRVVLAQQFQLAEFADLARGGPAHLSDEGLGELLASYRTGWLVAQTFEPHLPPDRRAAVVVAQRHVGEVIDAVAEEMHPDQDEANALHLGLSQVFRWGSQTGLMAYYLAATGRVVGTGAAGGYLANFRSDHLTPALDEQLPSPAPPHHPAGAGPSDVARPWRAALTGEQTQRLRQYLLTGVEPPAR